MAHRIDPDEGPSHDDIRRLQRPRPGFCPDCGRAVAEDADICPGCGHWIAGSPLREPPVAHHVRRQHRVLLALVLLGLMVLPLLRGCS